MSATLLWDVNVRRVTVSIPLGSTVLMEEEMNVNFLMLFNNQKNLKNPNNQYNQYSRNSQKKSKNQNSLKNLNNHNKMKHKQNNSVSFTKKIIV